MATITMYNSINVDDAYSPVFIAVPTGTAVATYGTDPTATWTDRTLPSSSSWNSVCYGREPNILVAVAATTVAASSPDGITWTARTIPVNKTWTSVAYGNGRFIAVADGAVETVYSTDGITWVQGGNLPATSNWSCVCYGLIGATPTWVAIAKTTADSAWSTDNGATWSSVGTILSTGDWRSVTFGNGKFVAVAYNSDKAATSTDGKNWTDQTMYSSSNWRSICYGEGLYVAVAYNTNKAATSPNGIDWTDRVLPSTANWNAICYGYSSIQNFGIFMTVAYGATTGSYSYDGISWAARTTSEAANFTSIAFANFNWNSSDTLDIRNNATITVNTHQNKFWKTVTGTYGKIRIENPTGTTINSAIGFYMGRTPATATLNSITPASGLFSIELEGNWIYLDNGTGLASQTFTLPSQYTEYIPCIEVETAVPDVFEVWNNISGATGPYMKIFGKDGLEFAGSGNRGNYFVQTPVSNPVAIISLTSGSNTAYSRRVTCADTAGVIPGAHITGTNIPTNTVVNRVIDSTTLELNVWCTTGGSGYTFTVYNPVQSQFTNAITVGDGTNGNVVPSGARVRIANIIFSDRTPVSTRTASHLLEGNITIATASPLSAQICMFGTSYVSVAQGSVVYFRHVGFNYKFALSECYNVDIDYLGTAASPTYWYYTTKWILRDSRYAISTPGGYTAPTSANVSIFSYITNAQIKHWHDVVYSSGHLTGTTPLNQVNVSYSDDMTWDNIRLVQLNCMRASFHLYVSARCYRSEFTNLGLYGANPIYALTSDDNTFSNVEYCLDMMKPVVSFASLFRVYNDPGNSWLDLVDDTKYYIKTRTFWNWMDRSSTNYYDSNEYSATPFQGGWQFPDYVSIRPTETIAHSVQLDWVRRTPETATVLYEIYRGTSEGFTDRLPSNRVYGSAATTVACTQGIKVASTSSAIRTFTFAAAGKTITAGGGTPGSFLTDGFIVGDSVFVNGSLYGNDGTYTITVLTATIMTVSEAVPSDETTGLAPAPYISITRATSKSQSARTFIYTAGTAGAGYITTSGVSWVQDNFAVGDVVDITGAHVPVNNGTFTINTLTATRMTVNEPTVAETTPTSTSAATTRIFTFATAGDTLTATGTTPGSFITDGWFVGDIVYCTSATNPGPFTIIDLTATVMTFSENVTDETCAAGIIAYRRITITLRKPNAGTRYYYRLRKYNFNSIAALGCSIPGYFFVTNRQVSTNTTVTLTTSVAHGFVVGQYVLVEGVGDPLTTGANAYIGIKQITAVPAVTTFQYAIASHTNENVADLMGRVSKAVLMSTNRAVTTNVATITTNYAHLFVVNQTVEITGMNDAAYNGTFLITTVPSTTTFTFALTHDNEDTADTGATIKNKSLFSAINVRSRATATAPVSVSTVTKTMAFTAAAKTIVLGTGSWLTDGFLPLDTIVITGSLAGNNGTYTINTVTASTLTVLETLPSNETGDADPVITVTGKYRVTLECPVVHGYVFGQDITVFGMNDATYNGNYKVRALPTTSSLTYSTDRVATEATAVDNSGKITTSALDFNKVYYLGGFRYASGTKFVTNLVNNLYNSMFAPGVVITGQGIPAGTTVETVNPSGRSMTISNNTTMSTATIFATTFATTRRAIASNVATITTATAHGMYIGSKVKLSTMTDATYNGTYTITSVPSPTRFRCALTHADEAELPDAAGTVSVADTILYIPAQVGMGITTAPLLKMPGLGVASVQSSSILALTQAPTATPAVQYTNAVFQTYTESAELTAVPNLYATAINFATYSRDFTNAAWVRSNINAATADSYQAPTISTWAATGGLDTLTASGAGGTATLTVNNLKASTEYTASFWVRADQTAAIPNGVAGSFAFGTTTTAFTATNKITQYSAVYTTGVGETSKNIVITITTSGQAIQAGDVMVNLGATPQCHINTAAANAVQLYPRATPLTLLAAYGRNFASNGTTNNQGIRLTIGTAPSGSYYTEIHLSSSAGFTPTTSTLVGTTFTRANYHFSLSGSSRNTFSGITKLAGGGAAGTSPIYATTSCISNVFRNIDIDMEYTNTIATGLLNLATACHSNIFQNIDFGKIRNYEVGTSIIYTQWANSFNNNQIQNIRADNYDIAISNQSLNTVHKGIAAGRAMPATTVNTYTLGSTSDGIAVAYGAAYGTMFYELYQAATEGVLQIVTEDTLGSTKPYSILYGTPTFTNGGLLYMPNVGDSVEFTWPHKIYGVSGFRKLIPLLNGFDLGGTPATVFDYQPALKIEYSIKTTGNYSAYQVATPELLSAEVLSATAGFYLKVKITTRQFMRHGAQTNLYVVDETIRGLTSGATAIVREIYDFGGTGCIVITDVTGEFIPAETIVNNTTSQVRSPNIATNGFALGPSFTSYISAIQLFTTIDQTKMYPVTTPTIRLTGLKPNSEVRVYNNSMVAIAGIEDIGNTTTWSTTYEYYTDVVGYIVIIALNYQVMRISDLTFGINGLDIPVQQILDRQYLNP